MKKISKLSICFFLFNVSMASAQFGIGTSTPNVSAVLDITSTTKGLLIPRMSTTDRDAIPSPANGLIVFNTTTNQIEINFGTTIVKDWKASASTNVFNTDGTLTSNRTISQGSNTLNFTGTGITTFNAGNVGIGVTTPTEKLEVNGAIKVGNTSNTPTAGVIRFNTIENKFEGYDGTSWVIFN